MRTRYLLPLLLLPFACDKKNLPPPPPPVATPAPVAVSVKAVTLGKAVGADKRIAEPMVVFDPQDPIYASVETEGSADKAKVEAKWTYFGAKGPTSLGESAMDLVGLTGPSINEFHVAKKNAWPRGDYQVEVLLNGTSAVKKGFVVK